jgi:hypothetical protein
VGSPWKSEIKMFQRRVRNVSMFMVCTSDWIMPHDGFENKEDAAPGDLSALKATGKSSKRWDSYPIDNWRQPIQPI